MIETHTRSITKSIIWRVLGIIILATITYAFTKNLIQTTGITLVHHAMFLVIFYLHERLWLVISRKSQWLDKWKKFFRPFTYEIILGHIVLGLISLAFTSSWTTVTLITFTYIWNKIWIYYVYDWLWRKKIKWGTKE